MHIYIDESGIFSNPDNRSNVPSCLGALVIPSSQKKKVFGEFEWIKTKWGQKGKELKGSKLDEVQIAIIVNMLKKYDVLLEITTIDLSLHTEDEITDYKRRSAVEITKSLTDKHEAHVVKQANEIRQLFEQMSNPLFVQATIMLWLIPRTLDHSILYYARRIPQELERFYWTIDAKGTTLIDFEKAWSTLIYVTMSTQSMKKPLALFEGGDYSYFKKFDRDRPIDSDLLEEFGINPDDVQDINIGKILGEHRKFEDSKNSLGLQLVDILVTGTRRALKGNLSKSGWEEIGSLMINKSNDGSRNGIQAIKLNVQDAAEGTIFPITTALDVYQTYLFKAKSILRPDELKSTK